MRQLVGSTIVERYRIERELGAGGMATVYVAHDLKHDRRVAVKVLRPELSAILGADRFLNEIRTTAHLQHPNILPLHDSGEVGGLIFYVMPLVEGESLRERLTREKQLPIDTAVRIARDVAEALDYAHRHGVIHRDVKPENILVHDGHAVVADFGIALAVRTAGGATRMTESGMSLGTPHYMSPEQAMGEREVTARSDVYALGCVLYEMLSGEPPFTGPTAQAIIAKVVTSDPAPLDSLRRTVPPHIAAAVHVALQRLPADRFESAKEFADAISGARTTPLPFAGASGIRRPAASWRAALPWALLAVVGVLAAWGWSRRTPEAPQSQVSRFQVAGDDDLQWGASGTNLALSRDGSQLIYRKRIGGQVGFVYRALADLSERPLAEVGTNPRFSPDGRWLVFMQDGGIRKLRVSGGSPILLADSANRPAWGDQGRILFERSGTLWLVSEAAGKPERLTTPDTSTGERMHRWPDFLPGGNAIVFSIRGPSDEGDDELAALDLSDRVVRRLGVSGVSPHFVAGGYLVFGRFDGTASTVPFDPKRLKVTGPEIQVIDKVVVRPGGAMELSVADNGTVAYMEGSSLSRLVLLDEGGRATPLVAQSDRFARARFSPKGDQVAVDIFEQRSGIGVWVLDVASGSTRRITRDSSSFLQEFSADGKSLLWVNRDSFQLRSQPLDGLAEPTVLGAWPDTTMLGIVVDPSGRWIVGIATDKGRAGRLPRPGTGLGGLTLGTDLALARLDSVPLHFRPLIATQFDEFSPAVSPDGRRLAYASTASGRSEIYVTSFPVPSISTRISTGGGVDPGWAPDGRTLYYRSPSRFMAARLGSPFTVVRTDSLFVLDRFPRAGVTPFTRAYDISPDGRQFLFTEPDASRRLVVTVSFQEELRQRFAELKAARR